MSLLNDSYFQRKCEQFVAWSDEVAVAFKTGDMQDYTVSGCFEYGVTLSVADQRLESCIMHDNLSMTITAYDDVWPVCQRISRIS